MEKMEIKIRVYPHIVKDETITVIAHGMVEYGIIFEADDFKKPHNVEEEIRNIGQSLVNQNYASFNKRNDENLTPHKFEPKKVEYDEGVLLGCINCYNYQARETDGYADSKIYKCLMWLQIAMLAVLVKKNGMRIPWGV